MSREPPRSSHVAVVSPPPPPKGVVAPARGILRRDGRAIRVDDPAVREMEPRRQYPGVGDVAEFLQHIANDGPWLVHGGELGAREILAPAGAHAENAAPPPPIARPPRLALGVINPPPGQLI